ncbi:hypothetical protein TPS_03478 [Trichinella pseudospiralis]
MSLANKWKQKATAAHDNMLKKDDVGNELRLNEVYCQKEEIDICKFAPAKLNDLAEEEEEEEEEEKELCLPAHRLAVSYFQPALCTSPKRRNDHDSRFNVSQLAANRGAMARQPLGQRIYPEKKPCLLI